MARSKHVSVRVPHPIMDAIEIRRQRNEFGDYHSLSELEIGLNVYLSFFPKIHEFTVELARMAQTEQDEVHDFSQRLAEADISVAALTEVKPLTAGEAL